MSEASNNMTPYRGDNEIVTQLRIMIQLIDQMTNEFRNRLDRLKRQYVNIIVGFKLDLSKENLMLGRLLGELTLVWISLWLIIRIWVLLILKKCPWDMGNVLESSEIVSLKEKNMEIILAKGVIIGTGTIMLS